MSRTRHLPVSDLQAQAALTTLCEKSISKKLTSAPEAILDILKRHCKQTIKNPIVYIECDIENATDSSFKTLYIYMHALGIEGTETCKKVGLILDTKHDLSEFTKRAKTLYKNVIAAYDQVIIKANPHLSYLLPHTQTPTSSSSTTPNTASLPTILEEEPSSSLEGTNPLTTSSKELSRSYP